MSLSKTFVTFILVVIETRKWLIFLKCHSHRIFSRERGRERFDTQIHSINTYTQWRNICWLIVAEFSLTNRLQSGFRSSDMCIKCFCSNKSHRKCYCVFAKNEHTFRGGREIERKREWGWVGSFWCLLYVQFHTLKTVHFLLLFPADMLSFFHSHSHLQSYNFIAHVNEKISSHLFFDIFIS